MDLVREPFGVAELNHTFTSIWSQAEAEIGAEISEPPKAKHQKETVRETSVTSVQKRKQQIFREKTEEEKKKSCNPKPSQNIQLCNFQNITHSSHLSLFAVNKARRLQQSYTLPRAHKEVSCLGFDSTAGNLRGLRFSKNSPASIV